MSFTTKFLHFDSANSNYISDITNTSTNVRNPFKASYSMNQTFRKVKRVYLSSVEFPVGFSNVRTGSCDTLKYILNGTAYTVVLPEKNYTAIGTLLLDLNNQMIMLSPNCAPILNVNYLQPNRLLFNFMGSVATSFSIIDTNLSKYVLGFRGLYDSLPTTVGVSPTYNASNSNWNLNYDNYISLYIPSLGSSCSMSNQLQTFKIPLNTVTNQVYFYQEGSSFRQWIDICDSNFTMSNITVIVYDKFGNNLNPNGLDFSFTLSLEIYN